MGAEDDDEDEVEDRKDSNKLVADCEAEGIVSRTLGECRVNGGAIRDAKYEASIRMYY